MIKKVIYNEAVKAAVAEIDEMFLKVTNYVSYPKGEYITLSQCLPVLEKHKNVLPLHVFRILQYLLVEFGREGLPIDNSESLEDKLIHIAIFREVKEYKRIAEARIQADYPDFFPENMVFEEVYALVYDRYLVDVLRAW